MTEKYGHFESYCTYIYVCAGHGELAGLLRGRMKENGWEACGRDDHHQFEGVATPRLALPCANRSAEGVYRCRVWNGDGSVTSDEAVVSFLSDGECVSLCV